MSIEPGDTPPKARLLRTILWGTITAALAGLAIFWALDNYLGNGSKAVRYSGEADIQSEFSLTDHTPFARQTFSGSELCGSGHSE